MDVRAWAGGGALVQHVVAALLPADHLLVQPWAEWDAGHLGIGALQIGSWRGRRRQEREMFENTPSLGRQAGPSEFLVLPYNELCGFGQITSPSLYISWR